MSDVLIFNLKIPDVNVNKQMFHADVYCCEIWFIFCTVYVY